MKRLECSSGLVSPSKAAEGCAGTPSPTDPVRDGIPPDSQAPTASVGATDLAVAYPLLSAPFLLCLGCSSRERLCVY